MSIPGHFEEPAASGTPRPQRRTLRLVSRGETEGGSAATVTIHNISATGLLLETGAPLIEGELLDVDLPDVGMTRAQVIWSSGNLHGCAFAAPVSPATLSATQLRSAVPLPHLQSPGRGMGEGFGGDRGTETGFALRLQRLRKSRGLTLSDLARKLGVSKPTVWAWEQGKARPVEARLAGLAEALGVSLSDIQAGEDNRRLHEVVEHARHQVAKAYGVGDDRVRILIEL